jgi:hypothetical protein
MNFIRGSIGPTGGAQFLLAIVLSPGVVTGAAETEQTLGPVRMSIPSEFVPAGAQHRGRQRQWMWTNTAQGAKALLEVSVTDLAARAHPSSPLPHATDPQTCVGELVRAVRLRRSLLVSSDVRPLVLAEAPAASATWTGALGSVTLTGAVYCGIFEQRFVVSFQVQDLGTVPSTTLRSVMRSIETIVPARSATRLPGACPSSADPGKLPAPHGTPGKAAALDAGGSGEQTTPEQDGQLLCGGHGQHDGAML